VLDLFKKQAASWSRRVVVFVDVIFAVSISAANHPPLFFSKALGRRAGGKEGGKGWFKSVVLRRGGRLRRPAAAAFRLPPPFLSRSRVQLARFFLAGNLLYAVRRWRSCADARACSGAPKNERRGVFWLGVVYFKASDKT
jgi:hypothetical protein